MKKYVQEATDENIWTSIKNNTFGRNKDIKDFIDGLELIDESACCILQSPADSDAFQSGRCAKHNGRPETMYF